MRLNDKTSVRFFNVKSAICQVVVATISNILTHSSGAYDFFFFIFSEIGKVQNRHAVHDCAIVFILCVYF